MIEIVGLHGLSEIRAGDDLSARTVRALAAGGLSLQDGDVVVFTSKIVSKAECRAVALRDDAPSPLA